MVVQALVQDVGHKAQGGCRIPVAIELVGRRLLVGNRGVNLIGQVHNDQVLCRIYHSQGTGPALVTHRVPGGLNAKVPGTAAIALPPPALAPGGGAVLPGGEVLIGVVAEEALVAIAALVHHHGSQLGQILSIGEQARMAGDTAHGVVGLLIVDFTLNGGGPDILEGNDPVLGVAVQLCGCHLVGGEAVLQRVEGDVGQVQRLIEGLAHKHVQALPGNLLHNEAQEHVIHIGVHRFGAGLVDQGSLANGLGHLLLANGVEHIFHAGSRLLGHLIKLIIVELGIGCKARLMLEDVSHGELLLPGLCRSQIRSAGALADPIGNLNGVLGKAGEELGNGIAEIQLAILHQILHSVIGGVHLGVGGQIVQGVCSHSLTVRLRGAVLVVGIHRTPGVGVHQLAILHHGHLGRGKAIVNVLLDHGIDHIQRLGVKTHLAGGSLHHLGIGNHHKGAQASRGDGHIRHLHRVAPIDGVLGRVNGKHAGGVQHGRGIYLYAIDEDPHAGHCPAHLEVHRALTGKAFKPGDAVVIAIGGGAAAPAGEVHRILVLATSEIPGCVDTGHGIHLDSRHGRGSRSSPFCANGVNAGLESSRPGFRVGQVGFLGYIRLDIALQVV